MFLAADYSTTYNAGKITQALGTMADSDRLSGMSDALLPGAGHTPGYGINDSGDSHFETTLTESVRTNVSVKGAARSGKENVWVVARCALTACLSSFVCGMMGGFSSPTLLELANNRTESSAQILSSDTLLPYLFGVSMLLEVRTAVVLLKMLFFGSDSNLCPVCYVYVLSADRSLVHNF